MRIIFGSIFFAVVLSGCAGPKFTASPITETIDTEIVIVNDKATRDGFEDRLEKWIADNDYKYVIVPDGSKHDLEKVTLEYVGHWGWDLALYLKQADINAYYKGQRIGEVNFKAPNTLNGNKFGDASERIGYMMDILFGKKTVEEGNKLLNPPPKK